jgi:hypothetical protein
MKRFIEGENRIQSTLFTESLDDYIAQDNAVRVVDTFIDDLDLKQLGFDRAEPSATGRPGYLPATLLKIYVCGYLNSCRRPEAGRFVFDGASDHIDAKNYFGGIDTNNLSSATTISLSATKTQCLLRNRHFEQI